MTDNNICDSCKFQYDFENRVCDDCAANNQYQQRTMPVGSRPKPVSYPPKKESGTGLNACPSCLHLVGKAICELYTGGQCGGAPRFEKWTPREKTKVERVKEHGGMKFCKGKNRVGLVLQGFAVAIWEMGWVGTMGAEKYTDNSWQTVPDAIQKYKEALDRHWLEWQMGEQFDPEFGTHHLAHVAWNALALLCLLIAQNIIKLTADTEKSATLSKLKEEDR